MNAATTSYWGFSQEMKILIHAPDIMLDEDDNLDAFR